MELSLKDIAQATGGILSNAPNPELLATAVTWDSREVKPGALYVAFPGERVDGHSFVEDAFKAGSVAAIVSKSTDVNGPTILVPDTTKALQDLAAHWRRQLKAKVVAITGSTGKTSTKALVRDVLRAAGSVVATVGNRNNEIGVPRTLLEANYSTDFIVVEMGMRGLGQIDELCACAQPHWGLITNVGESHMELLGSREAIAQAKGELFQNLPSGGKAFVNGTDPFALRVCASSSLKERFVAIEVFSSEPLPEAQAQALAGQTYVWAEAIEIQSSGQPRFILVSGSLDAAGTLERKASTLCTLAVRGLHNVSNATSAAAVGLAAGLSLEACAQALENSQPEEGRQEYLISPSGAIIINDAYNANPDSMAAALESLAALAVEGRRIAVLGDMGELGPIAEEAHRRVGAKAAATAVDLLVCVGSQSQAIADAAAENGLSRSTIIEAGSLDAALAAVSKTLQPKDAVLVKASHFMGFEKIVKGLVD